MPQRREKKSPSAKDRRPIKKKMSILNTENIEWIDYKDVNLLRRFMSERAKIRARRVTGNDQQQQAAVAKAIKLAREMALLPYSVRQVTQRPRAAATAATGATAASCGCRRAPRRRRPRRRRRRSSTRRPICSTVPRPSSTRLGSVDGDGDERCRSTIAAVRGRRRGRVLMKIVLRADVEHVGQKGDIVDVADGYARNFLVPRGLALARDRRSPEAGRRDAPQPRRP